MCFVSYLKWCQNERSVGSGRWHWSERSVCQVSEIERRVPRVLIAALQRSPSPKCAAGRMLLLKRFCLGDCL